MNGLSIVEKFIMTYSGYHYKKPEQEDCMMSEIKSMGQNARTNFVEFGNIVNSKLSGYKMYKCSSWVNMSQIIPDYLWIQFKKIGYEHLPSSISLAAKKVQDKFFFYVAVEIKDSEASKTDFRKHNLILDIPLSYEELYYSGDNSKYFNLGNDADYARSLINKKFISKVRVQKDINIHSRNDTIASVVNAINILEPYYKMIINNSEINAETTSKPLTDICEWIIPCNILYYDVIGAFNELKKIEWKQSANIKENDIVYIYLGKPFKQIKYKCIARKVDLESAGRIDDSKFILDGSNYTNYGRYMELEMVSEYDDQQFPYYDLKNKGLNSVQGPSRVREELSHYIKLIEIKMDKLSIEQSNKDDEMLPKDFEQVHGDENLNDNIERTSKKAPKIVDGIKIYPRNKRVAVHALAHAKYLCEIDKSHVTFKRRNSDINYTEPHHLIPLKYSELFDYSLDVKENIVSLCSNCHNNLHYGDDYEKLLRVLYEERIGRLTKVGLYISFEDLLEMYS